MAFSGRMSFDLHHRDLNEQLVRIAARLPPLIGERSGERIEVRVELGELPGLVRIDTDRLEEIVVKLALNAHDAMPEGGVLTLGSGWVEAAAGGSPGAAPGRFAVLRIADSGIGMDEVTRQRLFEPFFTTKRRERGTGLGLSIVHNLVRQLGGRIEVESEIDRGSAFRIYLPLVVPVSIEQA
jgi:signal transduction histidine kinase